MTPVEVDKFVVLAAYVRMVAREMRLGDWRIIVSNSPAQDGAVADVCCTTGRKVAVVRVCGEFFGMPAEEQRHAVVHEMLHPHFHPVMSAFADLRNQLAPAAFQAFMDRSIEALEYGIDGVADAFDKSLPTIAEAVGMGVLDTADVEVRSDDGDGGREPKTRLSRR